MASPVIQFKRGSSSLIASGIVSFREGEPGFTTDKYDFYIGSDSTSLGNKFFGSSRYWSREDGSSSAGLNLVDEAGSNYIQLRAETGLSGISTYTFPGTPINGKVLSTDVNGNLSWIDQINVLGVQEIVIGIGTFTENVAFTTTTVSTSTTTGAVTIAGGLGVAGTSYFGGDLHVENGDLYTNLTNNRVVIVGASGQLEDDPNFTFDGSQLYVNVSTTSTNKDTGALVVDGGVGIEENLNVGGNLSVGGTSYFTGIATFASGVVNLGDESSDIINIGGRIGTNLVPTTDDSYDVGISTLNWRNAHFSGIGTFESGSQSANLKVGIDDADTITSTSGNITIGSVGGGTVSIYPHVDIYGDLDVTGNVSVGGTTITLRGQNVFIENKDIVLGYTTAITPTDTTANHAGVAIASTEGTPLVDFPLSGINTLPTTYKQMMWFKSGTLGFSTDLFAFNYGVAIGTTEVASGVRLAVGTGITMSDTKITATTGSFTNLSVGVGTFTTIEVDNIIGNLTGTISTATRALTVDVQDAADTDGTYHLTFVDSNNDPASTEILYTDDAIQYNPSTNTINFTTAVISDTLTVTGGITGTATTATRSTLVDTTGTTTNANYYMLFADTSAGENSETVRVSAGASFNPSTNTLGLSVLNTGAIKSASGVDSITIQNSSGDVGISTNLTVDGSLTVKGSITSVNSENLKVKDTLIDLGLIDNGSGTLVQPTSDANLDVGLLLNYYSGAAKVAGVYWDDSVSRVVLGSDISESNGVLTSNTYADLEIGSLWLNDCAGQTQVITCSGTERFLNNITVDGGTF